MEVVPLSRTRSSAIGSTLLTGHSFPRLVGGTLRFGSPQALRLVLRAMPIDLQGFSIIYVSRISMLTMLCAGY
jgi:hypothetical protein